MHFYGSEKANGFPRLRTYASRSFLAETGSTAAFLAITKHRVEFSKNRERREACGPELGRYGQTNGGREDDYGRRHE